MRQADAVDLVVDVQALDVLSVVFHDDVDDLTMLGELHYLVAEMDDTYSHPRWRSRLGRGLRS